MSYISCNSDFVMERFKRIYVDWVLQQFELEGFSLEIETYANPISKLNAKEQVNCKNIL